MMNRVLLAVGLSLALQQLPAFGQTAQEPAPADKPGVAAVPRHDTASLVEAARAAKAKRKTNPKRKVITNADVKRSTAKLQETELAPLPVELTKSGGGMVAEHEARKKAIRAAEARVAEAEKLVAGLDKEVARLEMSFYEENDPNYRDDVIQKRFEQARRQLDTARQELADARDALTALTAPATPLPPT
jgi:exonuclease VII small subunit